MNWNEVIHSRSTRICLSILLIIALLLGLCYPGIALRTVQPENPIEDQSIMEISTLKMGESNGDGGSDESADQTSAEPTVQNETEPEETDPEETEPEETEPEETEPEETEPEETEPEETKPEETEPEQTNPDETIPEQTQPEPEDDEPDVGDGDEGQEDGNQGEEGGEESDLDLAMVMTWYKYGTWPKTIVCGPSEPVSKTLNTAQLVDNKLRYSFSLTGSEADYVQITSVQLKEGDGQYTEVPFTGETVIDLSDTSAERDYMFLINAHLEKWDAQGGLIEQDITFTYVLRCCYVLDAELELSWRKNGDSTGMITCAADGSAAKTVESNELTENVFSYTAQIVGSLEGKLVSASYTTASGGSGTLDPEGDALVLQSAGGTDRETYNLTFEAQISDEDGEARTVWYFVTIEYVEIPDVQLSCKVEETMQTLQCSPGGQVSASVKNNQLRNNGVILVMELSGDDSGSASIIKVEYASDSGKSGKLPTSSAAEERYSLNMGLPEGYTRDSYLVTVTVLADGQWLTYQIVLTNSMDASLEMRYTVDGEDRIVTCENGDTEYPETVYSDQLTDGLLTYEMEIAGAENSGVTISEVKCYQTGSGRTISLGAKDTVELLLKDGKEGNNQFTVLAQDSAGNRYTFRINIPYKNAGEESVVITTNLDDTDILTNGTTTNLRVWAWSEAEQKYLTATEVTVEFDGEAVEGLGLEYALNPANPETGDTNTHTLYICAEDAYGHFGEKTLTFTGQRNEAGQKVGTATIKVDMTAVGLGIVDSLSYEVLADEPISYSVVKAIMGHDTGDPFGACANALGWKGSYTGTLDSSFYLQSLTPGYTGNALYDSSWNSTSEEVLAYIDSYFGKGTGLATLWRCVYRNGLNKSGAASGTFGEFDFTSGSGWMYFLNGSYCPEQSMSEYYLKNGDVLTLRYTLAYGWDVGGGTAGYGNTVGYCVTALDGNISINHRMEYIKNEDGSISYVCHCCGLVEDCAHEHVVYMDQEDGTHIQFCEDCQTTIGDPVEHSWVKGDDACHVCSDCGAEETHFWKEIGNTATCTESGSKTVSCTVCDIVREEESPAKGHTLNSRWNYTDSEHYQKCSTCGEEVNRGEHKYVYDEGWEDYECSVCGVLHDWDVGCGGTLTVKEATCKKVTYRCDGCGLDLIREGTFGEYHAYSDGVCVHCGAQDPSYTPPETEPPVTDPPATEPPVTTPPETDPPDEESSDKEE